MATIYSLEERIKELEEENKLLRAKSDRLQALVDSADEPNGSMMWTSDHDKILARQEEQWKTWGVIEIATRNSNVLEYMKHWEGRALKAEAKNSRLETPKFDTSGVCDLCGKEYTRIRSKQRYCGSRCRTTSGMRRMRKTKKEATDGRKPESTL